MDLSKLPKQSPSSAEQTTPTPVDQLTDPPQAIATRGHAAPPKGIAIAGDIWFNAIIGIVLMALGATFARFAFAKLTGQPFHTIYTWPDGTEVAYFDVQGFQALTDMGIFLFGLVVLFEAASMAAVSVMPGSISKLLLAFALILTLATTALNIFICAKIFQAGTTPLLSGLAVAFGGWIIMNEWRMLKTAH